MECMDTTLRDGLQQAGLHQPNIEESIEIIQGNIALGVVDMEFGFPANRGQKERAMGLAQYVRRENLQIGVSCLARTIKSDIEAVAYVADKLARPVEAIMIIGSSKIRQLVQNWDPKEMEDWTRTCTQYAQSFGLTVNFLTEDGTRTDPMTLKRLYTAAMDEGAKRVTLADTVGMADPRMIENMMCFFQTMTAGRNVQIDFHPHDDLRMAVANSFAALENGARRIHVTHHRTGERVGNVDLYALTVAAHERGIYPVDLSSMKKIADRVAEILGIHVNPNQPVVGEYTQSTQTGMHGSAIANALAMGRPDLAERVYAPFPAGLVGQRSELLVGPLSGKSNFDAACGRLGIAPSIEIYHALSEMVENNGGILTDEQIHDGLEAGGML